MGYLMKKDTHNHFTNLSANLDSSSTLAFTKKLFGKAVMMAIMQAVSDA
jgi:hypothetical protein